MQLTAGPTQMTPHVSSGRNLTLDGLRGVAALLVTIHHLYLNAEASFIRHVPSWFDSAIRQLGGTGVNVFFVLSGFAIASSLGGASFSPNFLCRFILRRSVRLDPPYWVAIALALLLTQISLLLFPDVGPRQTVSLRQIAAHIFYLQDILHYENISAVFWTLCIELQFYLVLAIGLYLCTLGSRAPDVARSRALALVGGLFVASVIVSVGSIRLPVDGLFVRYWHMFALGVVSCWALAGVVGIGWWWALATVEITIVFAVHPSLGTLAPIFGAVTLLAASHFKQLSGLFTARPYQYAGQISYSLYLIHPLIGWSAISVSKRVLGEGPLVLGLVHLAIGLCASVASAAVLYALVERPALRLSRKISLRQQVLTETGLAAPSNTQRA